jgi:hypothetical protein
VLIFTLGERRIKENARELLLGAFGPNFFSSRQEINWRVSLGRFPLPARPTFLPKFSFFSPFSFGFCRRPTCDNIPSKKEKEIQERRRKELAAF